MNQQLLADILAAQEAESRRRMTHDFSADATPPDPGAILKNSLLKGMADIPDLAYQASRGPWNPLHPQLPLAPTPVNDYLTELGITHDDPEGSGQGLAILGRMAPSLLLPVPGSTTAKVGGKVAERLGTALEEAGTRMMPWQAQRGAVGDLTPKAEKLGEGLDDYRGGLKREVGERLPTLEEQLATMARRAQEDPEAFRALQAERQAGESETAGMLEAERAARGTKGAPEELSPEVRAARAEEQGYIGPLYHGTQHRPTERGTGIEGFNPRRTGKKTDTGWYGHGTYMTANPELASEYANYSRTDTSGGGTVYPLKARLKNPLAHTQVVGLGRDADAARITHATALRDRLSSMQGWTEKELELIRSVVPQPGKKSRELDDLVSGIGVKRFTKVLKANSHDGVILNILDPIDNEFTQPLHEVVAFDPNQIRSVHAQFDPKKQKSSDLLASLLAGGVGLPMMMQAAQNPEPN
jgi:hypothetical protein